MSRFDQMWFPLVRRFTSAASSSSAVSGFTPTPLAAFSALATTRSTPWRAMRRGTSRFTAVRPGFPKTSPRKRSFKGAGFRSRVRRTCQPGPSARRQGPSTRDSVTTASSGTSWGSAGTSVDDLHLEGDARPAPRRAGAGPAWRRSGRGRVPAVRRGRRRRRRGRRRGRWRRGGRRARSAGGSSARAGPGTSSAAPQAANSMARARPRRGAARRSACPAAAARRASSAVSTSAPSAAWSATVRAPLPGGEGGQAGGDVAGGGLAEGGGQRRTRTREQPLPEGALRRALVEVVDTKEKSPPHRPCGSVAWTCIATGGALRSTARRLLPRYAGACT